MEGNNTSATSNFSLAFALRGANDPLSAVGSIHSAGAGSNDGSIAMERENSMSDLLPDLEKLSLEKGRPLDVEDLDDAGWKAASKEGKVQELGTLGEGAGGAVTRCILKGGKTVFALKVSYLPDSETLTLLEILRRSRSRALLIPDFADHHD